MESTIEDKGFTLIELLVVIAIIGILAGMVMVSMSGARSKARDARRLQDMRQLISAQEMYYGQYDRYYTCSTSAGDCGGKPNSYPAAIPPYLTATPSDPGSNTYKGLDNTATGQDAYFCYFAKLENVNSTANGCTGTTKCGYYTASEGGNFYKTVEPSKLGATTDTTGCAVQN